MIHRVGHLYPSGGINDLEPQRMAPPEVELLVTRMPFRDTSHSSDRAIADDLEGNVSLLADAKVELIAFNCTAAGLILGPENLRKRILQATGLPCVITIEAVLAALAAFGARRIALFTPYQDEVVAAEIAYLHDRGYAVVAQSHRPCVDPLSQGSIPSGDWLRIASDTDLNGAEAILFSCAGIRIGETIGQIEAATGLPVVASNSALIWQICQRLGVTPPDTRFGKLMALRETV
ncbi:MAG: arylmalonate decarboxylase [Rhodobacteraceae bacterium]|nr:arylmalonate decarboxylase [Paracoccaceae bacterium]MAY45171.1 arylmalonate decarboxylase [Paracoccaceae bacterium]